MKRENNMSQSNYPEETTVGDQAFRERKAAYQTASSASTGTIVDEKGLHDRIAEKAYELYQKRGQVHGHDLDDWLEAERLILAKIRSQEPARTRRPRKRVVRPKR
jgi:hypothetical protein